MLFAFFLSLLAASSVFADLDTKLCTKELEGVVFVPKSCSYEYLKSINQELKAQAPLLWRSRREAYSIIQSFKEKYGVSVIIGDAFGKIYRFPGGAEITNYPSTIIHSGIQAYALGEGFSANVKLRRVASFDIYASLYWNPDGRMFTIYISKRTSQTLNICC